MAVQLDGKSQYFGQDETGINFTFGVFNQGVYNNDEYNINSGPTITVGTKLNIENVWTLGFWVKPKSNKEHATTLSAGTKDGKDGFRISLTPLPAETQVHGKRPAELRALIKDSDGTTIKHYGWGGWYQTEVWTHTFLQWDGIELTAYKDALLTTTGVVFVNVTGSMGAGDGRRIHYGSAIAGQFAAFSGTLGHFGMWDTILGPEELGTVVSGGFAADLTVASGSYASQGSLQHYWKPGEDSTSLGKDFISTGTPFDLTKQRNLTTDNVTPDSP